MFEARAQQIKQKIQQLITRYETAHPGQPLPKIEVRFDLRGRSAGQAGRQGFTYYMRFNRDMMMNQSWDHVYKDTVPHELAHIICLAQNIDRGHGPVWRRICQELGGTGQRCHEEAVIYAKGLTYQYTTSTGRTINLSETKHRRIQQGQYYLGGPALGRIDRSCSYKLLGETQACTTTEITKAVTAPLPTESTKAVPRTAQQQPSKAQLVRARIAQARVRNESMDVVVEWAVHCLSMTAALARSYVKNNWLKVL